MLKIPKPAMIQEPGFAARFAREIKALVHLVHPRIARVTDSGNHAGLLIAVLQYLPGGSLEDRRPRIPDGRKLPTKPEGLFGWLKEIAEALDFIHGKGYIHRDVKPGNIFFDANGNTFLGDFVIAKAAASNPGVRTAVTTLGVVLGTPGYMAPEQFTGKPCDSRSDQYALAVTVYEVLAGQGPFDGSSATAVLEKQSQGQAVPLHQVSPICPLTVADAVAKGMVREPRKRYPNCAEFARAVLQAVNVGSKNHQGTTLERGSNRQGPANQGHAGNERHMPCTHSRYARSQTRFATDPERAKAGASWRDLPYKTGMWRRGNALA